MMNQKVLHKQATDKKLSEDIASELRDIAMYPVQGFQTKRYLKDAEEYLASFNPSDETQVIYHTILEKIFAQNEYVYITKILSMCMYASRELDAERSFLRAEGFR